MILPQLGEFFLIIALGFALTQAFAAASPWRAGGFSAFAAWGEWGCVSAALLSLIALRVTDSFQVANVAEHSNSALPLLYKIVGAWGNHEGSMLLWAWVLALFGALLRAQDAAMTRTARGVQGALAAGVLLFILFTSNPFALLEYAPQDGADLNPLLQDIGLALHPPLLYVGYVGFSTVFALSVAALAHARAGREWARAAQVWILIAWAFLTFGIGLGSWWAYRELGWGGWWFWDPVENASLLPWLAGTALLHSNMVLERRGALAHWVLLLAILTFAMSLVGTFLVRSGLLTSVHSFASDPARGVMILAYMGVTVGGALTLYAMRAGNIDSEAQVEPVSREGAIAVNNLFFITGLSAVLLGTIYPLITEALSETRLSVGPPYFQRTFLPLMVPVLGLMGAALYIPRWRALQLPLLAAGAAGFTVLAVAEREAALGALGVGLAAWVGTATLRYKGAWSVKLAHLGVALLALGITGAGLWQREAEISALPRTRVELGGYIFTVTDLHSGEGANFRYLQAEVEVMGAGTLTPAYRLYNANGTATSESSIIRTAWGDIYATLGMAEGQGAVLKLHLKPMMHFLWGGCMLMGAGALLALMRYRKKP